MDIRDQVRQRFMRASTEKHGEHGVFPCTTMPQFERIVDVATELVHEAVDLGVGAETDRLSVPHRPEPPPNTLLADGDSGPPPRPSWEL